MTSQPPSMPPPPGGFAPHPRQPGPGPQPGSPGPPPQGYAPPPGYGPPGYPPAGPPGYPPGRPGYAPVPGYPVAPPPVSPSGQPLASFGDRLLAYLIDGAILGGTVMVIAIPVFFVFFATVGADLFTVPDPETGTIEMNPFDFLLPLLAVEAGLLVVALALQYVYHVEMPKRTGQTIGKRVMKLKIIPLDPAGSIGRTPLARRFLVQAGGGLVPGLTYVDGLWQLWDKPYQQCLHDKFARTVVVKVPA
ncbi:RDD family protein [Plantactinospora sp. BC1]|uniref:RDD family protein n=1 Tax=Plantactinospora sp. BC1 TaxID=2108470 RepID=UPI001F37592A|nr:RDD family protein [Plantactinospora sp. BC1]